MIRPESIDHAMQVIYQMEGYIEDLKDKLHECLCGDLEVALGKIQELEAKIEAMHEDAAGESI